MHGYALLIRVEFSVEHGDVLVLLLDPVAHVQRTAHDDKDQWRGQQTIHEEAQEHAHVVGLEVDNVPHQPIGQSLDVGCGLEIVPIDEFSPRSQVFTRLPEDLHDVGDLRGGHKAARISRGSP